MLIRNLQDNTYDGVPLPNVEGASFFREDGLVLSFSSRNRKSIADRLGKAACVKIMDMEALKQAIDRQLGCKGMMQPSRYTEDHQRNHFLKSVEDQWQCEYRIFWPLGKAAEVTIPKGLAKRVQLQLDEA